MPAEAVRSVSCIIPTHGRPDLLRHALTSVTAQTQAPSEVIVVDDTSVAEVRQLAEETAAHTGLVIRYLPHPSGTGASSSRNAGARMARGEILAFLDDDDLWLPRHLEASLAALARTGRPVAFAWLHVDRRERLARKVKVPPGLTAPQVLARNPGVTGSNIVVRQEAFFAVGGFDEGLWVSNDKDFLVRLLDAGLAYAVVPEALVRKVVHPGERLTTRSPRRAEGLRRYHEKYENRLSARDRRWLEFRLRRTISGGASSRGQRLRGLLGLCVLLGPAELLGVVEAAARRAVGLVRLPEGNRRS